MLENCSNPRHLPIAHMMPSNAKLSVRCPLCASLDQLEDVKNIIAELERVTDKLNAFFNEYPIP